MDLSDFAETAIKSMARRRALKQWRRIKEDIREATTLLNAEEISSLTVRDLLDNEKNPNQSKVIDRLAEEWELQIMRSLMDKLDESVED